jgi:hypothetical protein
MLRGGGGDVRSCAVNVSLDVPFQSTQGPQTLRAEGVPTGSLTMEVRIQKHGQL